LDTKAFNYKINYKNTGRGIAGTNYLNKATDQRFTFNLSHKTILPKMAFISYQKYEKSINK
jgi:hypothetical protein